MDEGASDSHFTRTLRPAYLIKWARDPGAHSMTTDTRAEAPACARATGGHAAQLGMRACMAAAHVLRGPSEPISGNHMQSVVISGHGRSSSFAGAIRANHMQSVAISGNQPQLTSPKRFPTLSIP